MYVPSVLRHDSIDLSYTKSAWCKWRWAAHENSHGNGNDLSRV